MPRAECTFKPQINKTSSSLAQKTAAISFRHGRRPGADTEATPPKRWGARTAHAGYLTMFFLFVGIWLIFYKIFDDESGIKLEKNMWIFRLRGYEMGFLLVPKDVTSRRNPLILKPVFTFWRILGPASGRPGGGWVATRLWFWWMSQWFPSIWSMFISKVSWFIHGSIKCPKTIEN